MWPFSRAKKSTLVKAADDVFWLRDAARMDGVISAASEAVSSGSHVLLVTHTAERVAQLADAGSRAGVPLDGLAHPITAPELATRQRGQPGPCVCITLAETLRPSPLHADVTPTRPANWVVIVVDRYPLRVRDEAIVRFADELAAARIAFHVCLEDPVFRLFAGNQTEQILRKLGMKDDDSISHAMLTRSVERAQSKLASTCPDHAHVEAWLADQLRK